MKVALDTNVLAYAEGINDAERKLATLRLIESLPQDEVVIPVQVLGELYNVLVRKAGRSGESVRVAVLNWSDAFSTPETSVWALIAATGLAADHRLSIWDAVILAVASEARCRLLLSEDMQDGFTWNGITVVNPYLATENPLLAAFLHG
jgi:predicted nucleic acid-binding protein